MNDNFLSCALKLAELSGRPVSPNSLIAALPLTLGPLTEENFIEAVKHLHFNAQSVIKPLHEINKAHAPCVLLLNDGQVALVKSINDDELLIYNPSFFSDFYSIKTSQISMLYSGKMIELEGIPQLEDVDSGKTYVYKKHWLWGTLLEFRHLYYQVGAAAFMTNVLSILLPLYSLNVYDRVIPNSSYPTLWVLSVGILIVFIFDFVLKIIKSHFVDVASKHSDVILSKSLVNKILSLPIERQSMSVGSLTQHIKELETIRDFFSSATLVSFIDLPFGILTLSVIGFVGGIWLFFIGLISMIIVFATGLIFQKMMATRMQDNFLLKNKKSSFLVELITGLENIKGIVAERRMQKNWEALSETHAKTAQSTNIFTTLSSTIFQFIQNLNYVLFVIVGVFLITANEMTMGGLIACTILSSRAIMPMVQGAALLTKFSQVKVAYTVIENIMNMPSESLASQTYVPHPILAGEIEFKNVGFRYNEEGHDILKDLSFKINPGDRLAIIGRIGSGKSTIEKLIMAFYYAQQGNILVDGLDVRQIDPIDLRSNICYLPQDIYLFSGTVFNNILLSDRHLEQQHVDNAIALSGVSEFIRHHPQGFNAQVGEGGKWLSGGQKQSIGLARALLHPSPILLLDEPTAMMDSLTEYQLLENLKHLKDTRTLIVVTHNLKFLSIVNKVLLVNNGRPQFFGSRDDFIKLMEKNNQEIDTSKIAAEYQSKEAINETHVPPEAPNNGKNSLS